jgi:hypothetical protein
MVGFSEPISAPLAVVVDEAVVLLYGYILDKMQIFNLI